MTSVAQIARPDTTLDTISDTPKRLSSTKAGSLKDDGGEAVTPKHQQQRPAKLSIGNRALRFLGRPVTPPTTPKPHGRRKRHGNNNNSNSKSLQTSQNLQSSVCSDELTRGSTTTDEWERLSMDDEASGVHMSRISAVDYAQHDGMSIHHDHRDLDKSQTDEHTQRGRKKRWWHTFTRSTTRHGSSSTDSGHSSETSSLASIEGSGKNTWNSRSMRQKKPARRGVVSLFYEHDIATPSASGSSNMHTSHSEGSSPMEDVAHALQVPALLGEAMGSNATAATAAAAAAALPVANARAMMELPLEVVSPMETSFGPDSPPLVEQSQPAGNAIRKPSLEQRKQAVMSIAEVAEPLVLTVNAATATVVESHDQPETAVGSKLPAASTTSMPGLDSISIVVTEPATSTKLRVSVSEPSGVSSPRPVYSVARHVLGFAVDPRFPELSTPGSTLSARGRRVGRSASPAVLRSLTPNCATPEQQAAQFGKLFVVPSAPIAEEAEELDDEVVDSHVLVADTVVTHAQVQLQKTPLPVGSESPQQLPVTAPRVATSNANLSMADFQVLALVGTGSFGQVSVVRHRATKEPFALKVIQKLPIVEQGQDEHVLEEQRLLLRTDTPFVVTLFATFQDRKALYFVLEYLNGGELFTYLREALRFTNTTAKFYASEVVCAIDYLHSQDIAYRDLKPENILLDSSGHIKLIDFGFARTMRATDRTWSLCGTPEYLAPEIILNKGHGREVDCWSIGVLLYEMLLGYPPFHGSNNVEMYENIITGKYSFPDCVPIYSQARLLVSQLLVSSISRRLTISEIKNHSWFEGVDWEVVKQRTRTPPFIPPVESSEDTSMFCPCDDAQEEMQWELWRRETASLGAAVEDKTETECSDLSEGSTDDCLSELIEQAASDVYDPLAQARHDHLRSLQSQASMPGLEAVTRLPDKPGFDLSLGSDTDEQMCREHATRTVQDLQQASRRQRRKERQERREQLFAQFDSVNPRFAKQLQLL
ncbi:AGC/PKA protein kinase [Capsaspora owczarzaki ATCC 30864]|uniref:AGC/PKA protein kinase n=1 Tax=Capsaspora owczarzaki (strain ATCC 30864) TaxID=595528 RepID=A0A0D2WKM7_CAPO3|nr:AGC/PKA protein kinase [Capsaspora owczarzaki ATCC 30864]